MSTERKALLTFEICALFLFVFTLFVVFVQLNLTLGLAKATILLVDNAEDAMQDPDGTNDEADRGVSSSNVNLAAFGGGTRWSPAAFGDVSRGGAVRRWRRFVRVGPTLSNGGWGVGVGAGPRRVRRGRCCHRRALRLRSCEDLCARKRHQPLRYLRV
jgi:hypothetical protein